MKSLEVNMEESAKGMSLTFSGRFDERSELPDLGKFSGGLLSIDFAGLKYINSIAIGIWMKWLNKVTAGKEVQFEFHNCPFLIVNQFNSVKGFMPENSVVKTVLAPFYCESCDENHEIIYQEGAQYKANPVSWNHIDAPCPDCKSAMEFDAMEENYFGFLSRSKS